jgi:hypothetical protein
MALHGSLEDFSLPEVFCLVRSSRKSGILHVSSATAEGSVSFRDGAVFFARSDWRVKPLGERLVDAGHISREDLDRALAEQASEPAGGRRLGEILIDAGRISPLVLESFVDGQIQETVFDLMRWDTGEFSFEVTSQVADEDIGLTVSTENLIMEGARLLEQWQRIRRKVPSVDAVFRLTSAPLAESVEIDLTPAEWNLLVRVDGVRSVAELARETGQTDFEVGKILYGLLSAGLIEATEEEGAEPAASGSEPAAFPEPAPPSAPVPSPEPAPVDEPAPLAGAPGSAERTPMIEPEVVETPDEEPSSDATSELADLSGGLGDELVALTGGGRPQTGRSRRRSGETAEKITIHRDASIDRAALLAIVARVDGL